MADEIPAIPVTQKDTGNPGKEDWSAVVSSKEFMWFVAKATAGIQAAPLAIPWLHTIGLTIEPNSIAAGLLPAVLGGLMHSMQDWASLKTQWKWI